MEPKWLTEARRYIGQKEVPGTASNPLIKALWLKLKGGAWFWKAYGEDDSKLPWCGAFAAYCIKAAGIEPPIKYASAREWLMWGEVLRYPHHGCIVVFTREAGGHVGFVVGVDERQRLMVLGGNQGDGVNIKPFERLRVAGYRWPAGVEAQADVALLVLKTNEASSQNEA